MILIKLARLIVRIEQHKSLFEPVLEFSQETEVNSLAVTSPSV